MTPEQRIVAEMRLDGIERSPEEMRSVLDAVMAGPSNKLVEFAGILTRDQVADCIVKHLRDFREWEANEGREN